MIVVTSQMMMRQAIAPMGNDYLYCPQNRVALFQSGVGPFQIAPHKRASTVGAGLFPPVAGFENHSGPVLIR